MVAIGRQGDGSMKLGRRPTLFILVATILLNLLLRYPSSDHETGVDSIFIHALSGSIYDHGHAAWILNPLSYLGWYPLSYPSAGPFLFAATSSVTGMNLEGSILLISFMLGPLGILSAFMMAREVRHGETLAVVVALLYGLAPRFLVFTIWSASTRALFMSLLPIFTWSILVSYRRPSKLSYGMLVVSTLLLTATHRLAILLAVVFVAFIVAIVLVQGARLLRTLFPQSLLRESVRRGFPYVALGAVVAMIAGMMIATDVLQEYSQGEIASGSAPSIEILNLMVSLARSSGFALALMPVGLVVLTRQKNKRITEPFLAAVSIGLVPTLLLRVYTGFYILPFLAILGGLGFIGIMKLLRRHKRLGKLGGVVLVAVIVAFSGLVLNIELSQSTQISTQTYDTGLYVRGNGLGGTLVATDGLMGIQVGAISGNGLLPVGGAGTTFQSPELLAYGFYKASDVDSAISRIPLLGLTIDSDSLWSVSNIQAEQDWVTILNSRFGQIPMDLRTRYQPTYYLEGKAQAGTYLAFGNTYCSALGQSVHEQGYTVYDNGQETLWWLGVPASPLGMGIVPKPCG